MNPKSSSQVQSFSADDLTVTASEPWFKVKVQVINRYIEAFVGHVAGRADEIIFIDLLAGSGLYAWGHQKEIFCNAGFQSLTSGLPITRWIFCEHDAEQAQALRFRVNKYFKNFPITIIDAPPDQLTAKLCEVVPASKGNHKVAVCCLVDAFSLEMPFQRIEMLASFGWNFIMPFTFPLNARVNQRYYIDDHKEKLQRFIGIHADSVTAAENNLQFYQRLVRTYENNMLVLGMNTALSVHKMASQWMELPAYYIGFFSRKISAKAVQQEVESAQHPQFELF